MKKDELKPAKISKVNTDYHTVTTCKIAHLHVLTEGPIKEEEG